METKRIELEIGLSQTTNPKWKKLWDILLRPVQDKTDSYSQEVIPPIDTLPKKPHDKFKPQQLNLFSLDFKDLERENIDHQMNQEA